MEPELENLLKQKKNIEEKIQNHYRKYYNKYETQKDTVSSENPYSRLFALKKMGIVHNYEDFSSKSVLIVGKSHLCSPRLNFTILYSQLSSILIFPESIPSQPTSKHYLFSKVIHRRLSQNRQQNPSFPSSLPLKITKFPAKMK